MEAYFGYLTTFSAALAAFSMAALLLRRYLVAAVGFVMLGSGAIGIVWDGWTARAGHHMELTALFGSGRALAA